MVKITQTPDTITHETTIPKPIPIPMAGPIAIPIPISIPMPITKSLNGEAKFSLKDKETAGSYEDVNSQTAHCDGQSFSLPKQLIEDESLTLHRPIPESQYRPNFSSSILRPGASFSGYQKSENSKYRVNVQIQNVDMKESYMDGYLQIHSLTKEHPTLTTFFEGEMIGCKHSFVTKHSEWRTNETVDFHHWSKFPAFKSLIAHQKDARRPDFRLPDWEDRQQIFMRWKEHFLVPDHRKTDLTGASFDGFYYICFDQVSGNITGTYYHEKCEHGQKLELFPDRLPYTNLGFEFR